MNRKSVLYLCLSVGTVFAILAFLLSFIGGDFLPSDSTWLDALIIAGICGLIGGLVCLSLYWMSTYKVPSSKYKEYPFLKKSLNVTCILSCIIFGLFLAGTLGAWLLKISIPTILNLGEYLIVFIIGSVVLAIVINGIRIAVLWVGHFFHINWKFLLRTVLIFILLSAITFGLALSNSALEFSLTVSGATIGTAVIGGILGAILIPILSYMWTYKISDTSSKKQIFLGRYLKSTVILSAIFLAVYAIYVLSIWFMGRSIFMDLSLGQYLIVAILGSIIPALFAGPIISFLYFLIQQAKDPIQIIIISITGLLCSTLISIWSMLRNGLPDDTIQWTVTVLIIPFSVIVLLAWVLFREGQVKEKTKNSKYKIPFWDILVSAFSAPALLITLLNSSTLPPLKNFTPNQNQSVIEETIQRQDQEEESK